MYNLATYIFKGQCYDAGLNSTICCDFCSHKLRYCFTLKSDNEKVTIGSCCFKSFWPWNKMLFNQLQAAKVWLMSSVSGEARDTKQANERASFQRAQKYFKEARKRAKERLREYQKTTGKQWLPENLFELNVIVEQALPEYKRASLRTRWLMQRAEQIMEKL